VAATDVRQSRPVPNRFRSQSTMQTKSAVHAAYQHARLHPVACFSRACCADSGDARAYGMVDGHEQHSAVRLVFSNWRSYPQSRRDRSHRSLPICKGMLLLQTFVRGHSVASRFRDLITIPSAVARSITLTFCRNPCVTCPIGLSGPHSEAT
jgi:hypothetical protein